jgi:hypothetical protein
MRRPRLPVFLRDLALIVAGFFGVAALLHVVVTLVAG